MIKVIYKTLRNGSEKLVFELRNNVTNITSIAKISINIKKTKKMIT